MFTAIYWFASNIDLKQNPVSHLLFWLLGFPILASIGLVALARLVEVLQGNLDPTIHYDPPFDEWSN